MEEIKDIQQEKPKEQAARTKYNDEIVLLSFETGHGSGGFAKITQALPTLVILLLFLLYRYFDDLNIDINSWFQGDELLLTIGAGVVLYLLVFMLIPAVFRGASILLSRPRQEIRFTENGIRALPIGNYFYSARSRKRDRANMALDYSGIRHFESDPGHIRVYPRLTLNNVFQDTTLAGLIGVPIRMEIPIEKQAEAMAILMGRINSHI